MKSCAHSHAGGARTGGSPPNNSGRSAHHMPPPPTGADQRVPARRTELRSSEAPPQVHKLTLRWTLQGLGNVDIVLHIRLDAVTAPLDLLCEQHRGKLSWREDYTSPARASSFWNPLSRKLLHASPETILIFTQTELYAPWLSAAASCSDRTHRQRSLRRCLWTPSLQHRAPTVPLA